MLSARRLATISGGGTERIWMSWSGSMPCSATIVAQQVIVHRIVERHRELDALPVLRIALVLVLDRKRDRLAVDVFDRRHRVGDRIGAGAHGDRDRHRRQHVRGVVFLVDGLVAHHRPAGGLDHFDVEAVLLVEAHRLRHDDRRGAGDRDEADLEVFLLERPALRQTPRSRSRAGRIATRPPARSRRRPISGRRGARRPAETSRASRRRRPRLRSASPRSRSDGRHCNCCARLIMLGLADVTAAGAAPADSDGGWHRTDCRKWTWTLPLRSLRLARWSKRACQSRFGRRRCSAVQSLTPADLHDYEIFVIYDNS